MGRFCGVYDKLNQALDEMPYDELGISVEVKEQVFFRFHTLLFLLWNSYWDSHFGFASLY